MPVWVLIVANIPAYLLVGWVMFDTGHGFVDTLKAYLTPRFVHMIRGEAGEGEFAFLKLAAFIITCVAIVYGEHKLIVTYFM